MVAFRISGIVRAARQAHERVRSGIPAAERGAFLAGLQGTIHRIEQLCAEGGARPGDLPAPSRRALSDLRALAALSPDALPAPTGARPTRRITISNVVGTLDRTLEALADADSVHADLVDDDPFGDLGWVVDGARRCVEAVDRICAEEESTPCALPTRTGRAYACLRWLLDPENRERYLEQRDAVASALMRALAQHPSDRPAWRGRVPAVSFRPGTAVSRIGVQEVHLRCRLNLGWLGATDHELAAFAEVAVRQGDAEPAARHAVTRFLESEAYGALHLELEALREDPDDRPQGRVHDLDEIFERLDARFFQGRVARPRLSWHASASLRRFGSYIPSRDQVLVDVRLDDEMVPDFVTEFVLYHELLHKVHGSEMRGRRRHVHTPAFRADERLYPRADEAERWLARLAQTTAATTPLEPEPAPEPEPEPAPVPRREMPAPPATVPPLSSSKVPRNAPCPCGSGRKHKKCCLR